MRLADFLKLPDQSATDLARSCGVAVSTITRVAKGEKKPSLALMEEIRLQTRGAVAPNDYLPPLVLDEAPIAAQAEG